MATAQSLAQHVRALAASIREDSNEPQDLSGEFDWLRRIERYGRFSSDTKALLTDLSTVTLAADAADSAWIVLLLPEGEWSGWFSDDRPRMWRWPPWWL